MKRYVKRNVVNSRLKAFSSFTDVFTGSSLKSGWKQIYGSWTNGIGQISSTSNGMVVIPVSKSNATVVATIPSGQTGTGVVFWQQDINNYWAAYGYSSNYNISNCNNGTCTGTENYTATRSCSCYTTYGTCQSSSVPSYGTCSLVTTYGTCALTNTYDTCAQVALYGYCTSSSSTTTVIDGCYSAFSGCPAGDTETSAPGICNCPTGANKHCCYHSSTTLTWSYSCCSYTGQVCQYGTGYNYAGCSYPGQSILVGSSWNYSGCSSNGQVVATGSSWNYGGCSSNGQVVYLGSYTSWNYSGCSSDGQVVSTGQASTCNNGSCSGTEQYTATRNCSCTLGINRYIRVIKVLNGVKSTVGDISVSSTPTTITAVTSGNSVQISGSNGSQTFTNSDGTIYKNFGIIKDDGGVESGSTITQFSALAS